MGERPCKESFVSIFATQGIKSYASAIDDCSPFCRCQTETVSNYSRGPISDDEYLIRLVIAPQHVKEGKAGKKPKDAVLSHAESIGMSVFRDDAPTEEIMLVAKKLVDSAKKS